MLWTISSPKVSVSQFETVDISEVLYEFEGPKIFTTNGDGSLLRLWYECGEDFEAETLRYLVVPTSRAHIDQLKSGKKTVHDLLKQPWLWAVDLNHDFNAVSAWVLDGLDNIPLKAKPEPHATLYPEHMPLLSYRMVGVGLQEGTVPSSVVSRAVNAPTSAIKRLLEAVSSGLSQGRPEEAFRRIYDLPAARFAYNSFEVSFSAPIDVQLSFNESGRSSYEEVSKSLDQAFRWLNTQANEDEPDTYVLEALKELTPPAHGQVERAELRGALIRGSRPVSLTRSHRKLVTQALGRKRFFDQELIQSSGQVRELDKDNLSFMLRNRPGEAGELKCLFSEEQYDDIFDFFDGDTFVVVTGRLKKNKNILEIGDVAPVSSDES